MAQKENMEFFVLVFLSHLCNYVLVILRSLPPLRVHEDEMACGSVRIVELYQE